MTKLTTVPLLQDPPFVTTVTAEELLARTPLSDGEPDWRRTRPVKPRPAATDGEASVDWGLVVVLRRKASELIAAQLADHYDNHGVAMPEVDRRLLGRSVIRQVVRDHAEDLSSNGQALWPIALEHAYALALLEKCKWNVTKAARAAGVNRSTFDSRLRKLGITKE